MKILFRSYIYTVIMVIHAWKNLVNMYMYFKQPM